MLDSSALATPKTAASPRVKVGRSATISVAMPSAAIAGICRAGRISMAVSNTLLGGQRMAMPSGMTAADTPSFAPA